MPTHPFASTHQTRARRRLLPSPDRATLAPADAAAVPIALAPALVSPPGHDGDTPERFRLTIERLASPALRQQFIAQLSRQCGNAAIQRVLAGDRAAVPADVDSSPQRSGRLIPSATHPRRLQFPHRQRTRACPLLRQAHGPP